MSNTNTTYKRVTKRNSEKYFQDFLAKQETSLQWLFNFLESSQGINKSELDFSSNSLILLWESSSQYIEMIKPIPNYNENQSQLPLWFYLHTEFLYREDVGGYAALSLQIMEALIYYFAEVFIKNHHLKWEIWNEQKPRTVYNFLPVLKLKSGGEMYPFEQIVACSAKAASHPEKASENNLFNLYTNLVECV